MDVEGVGQPPFMAIHRENHPQDVGIFWIFRIIFRENNFFLNPFFSKSQRFCELGPSLVVPYGMICDATHPEAGEGREAFHDLPHADLWNGVGCGGSQKCEIAQLDLIDLLLSHFSDFSRPKSDDDSNPNYQKIGWDNFDSPHI